MFARTNPALGIRGWIKCFGGAKHHHIEPPYYLKHQPGNQWFNCVHDGESTAYGTGFTFKPMNHIYRFRWNYNHRGANTLLLRNPGGKCPHWLEVSVWRKLKPHIFNHEALPHAVLLTLTSCLVIWNLTRYVFFHPDLTIYNIIYFSMRRFVNVLRNQELPNLDTPVFRWFQATPEFGMMNPMREMIDMGLHANDPYLEYLKAIGKDDLLQKKPGEPGYNTAMNYLPQHKWGWSYKEANAPSKNPVPTASA